LEWSVAKKIAKNPNDESIYEAWAKFSDHQARKYPGLVKRRKKEADRYFNRV
jgi:antibiotic biosynthesis monooxygenase (ABM) superfamily enzyme